MEATPEATSSYDADGVQWAWDGTSLTRANECPRKYYYENICGWSRPKGVHLWFGGHYATALEKFHHLLADGADREDAIREVVLDTIKATWNDGQPDTFDDANKTRETLVRTLIWYFEEFKDESLRTHILPDGKPAVENSFRVPFDNGIVYCGHIDRLAVDSEDQFFITDQKTTKSTIGPYYMKSFKPHIQFGGYTFAGKMIYDIPIRGVIVDAVQIAVGFSRFSRFPITFTDDELNEWYDEAMMTIQRMQQYTRENHFPRNTTACSNYGGCPFREVCSRPPQVRENFLKADFKKEEPWNPIVPR